MLIPKLDKVRAGALTHAHSHIQSYRPIFPECEVKWALGNITTNKASGGDRIPAELF